MSFTPEQPNRLEKIVRWAKDHASPSEQTLYIESIQTDQLRSSVMEAINAEGFRDTYDFFYLPRCFQSKKNKGYAFINFINPEAAREFSLVINAKRKLQRSNWVVKTSSLQGLQANVAKWARSRSVRIRDPEVLPYLRGLKELEGVHPMRAIAPDCSDMPVPERLNLGVKVVQDEVVMEPVAPSYNVGPSYNPGPSYSAGPSYNMFDYKIHGCSIYFQETVHPAPGCTRRLRAMLVPLLGAVRRALAPST